MGRPKTLSKSIPGFLNVVVYFWPQIRKQSKLITASFLALLAEIVFRLLEPWPLKFILDELIVNSPSKSKSFSFISDIDSTTLLTVSALAVIVFTGMRALLRYWNRVGFALIGNKVLTEVRAKLYRHLQCLPLSFHNKAKSGDLTIRVVGDVGQLKEIAITALLPLIGNTMILIGMFLIMFIFNWKLSLLALATFPLFALITARYSKKIRSVSKDQKTRESALASTAAESMTAIKTVQAMSLGNEFESSFTSQNEKSLKDGVKAKKLLAGHERVTGVLGAVGTALVLWFGARLVMNNELSAGDLIVFLSYLKSSSSLLGNFTKYTDRIAKATASGDRIMEILSEVPSIANHPDAVIAPKFKGLIEFEDLNFSYEQGNTTIENVNMTIKPGQRLVILGPSGSGKSTIASLILRLYDPVSGKIKIDDKNIRYYTVDSLRSQISIILQETVLFATTIKENISFGRPNTSIEDIVSAAKLANIHDFIESLPLGYDTMVGERGVNLSGGQRQRIAIARAAIRKSPILILDEPTTGLDSENELAVNRSLARLSENCTTVLITHNISVINENDTVLYLDDGHVSECGTHRELLNKNSKYAHFYRLSHLKEVPSLQNEDSYAI